MNTQKLINLSILLLVVIMPPLCRASEIRQEEYRFRMELTRNISRETFVLGDFPAPSLLKPAVAAPEAEKTFPGLALRISGRTAHRQAAAKTIVGVDSNCIIPMVLFARGSAELSEQAIKTLPDSVASCVTRKTPLTVTGYTCDLNTQELNDRLARQRAESVAELLKRHGFTVAEVRGKGKSGYRTTDPDKRSLNRRVEITMADNPPSQP
jgi:outer membrane protein OmpA-like peptidoglycan-associated protein